MCADRLRTDGVQGRNGHDLAYPAPQVFEQDQPLIRENEVVGRGLQ
jgi:hypothetical protein